MNTFVISTHLRASFRSIGAYVRAAPVAVPRLRSWETPRRERIRVRNEAFELVLPPGARAAVLDCRKDDRHLLLSLQDVRSAPERFLCGFDERHWFAAAVTATNVPGAKDSLMPPEVREAARRAGVRHADLHRRHTKGFVRQGEWFFVPVDEEPARLTMTIHRREPLIRPGGGKPHIVDELVRDRGELVWQHPQHAPAGIVAEEFAKMPEQIRHASGWNRRLRISEQDKVFVRGAVRHADHATIWLGGWHRVFINREVRPESLGFLD